MKKDFHLIISAIPQFKDWYHQTKRTLPWRDNPAPYPVWVSEIMLQQTQVKTVIPYFNRWMNHFPNLKRLAKASIEEVLKQWEGLGYYSRARNLKKGAEIIFKNKRWPKTKEEWEEIPGVGRYTAGAILSIAFNQPMAVLDANIVRVFSRLFCLGEDEDKETYWNISLKGVQAAQKLNFDPRDFNQALMELGALICTPKNPQCEICPFNQVCLAKKRNVVELYPSPKKKPAIKKLEETKYFILSADKKEILLIQNKKGTWREGMYDFLDTLPIEFSGTKMKEEISSYTVTHHKIKRNTHFYHFKNAKTLLQWVSLSKINSIPLSTPAKKTLMEYLK